MKSKGFTLIELLVVLALIGMVSGVVVPTLWGQYSRFEERRTIMRFWDTVASQARDYRKRGENYYIIQNDSEIIDRAQHYGLLVEEIQPMLFRADKFVTDGYFVLKTKRNNYWQISVAMPDGAVTIEPR